MRRLFVVVLGLLVAACSWHDAPTRPSTSGLVPGLDDGPFFSNPTPIEVNDRIEGTLTLADPVCRWAYEVHAACRQYAVVASESGALTALLPRNNDLDMSLCIVVGEGGSTFCNDLSQRTSVIAARWSESL